MHRFPTDILLVRWQHHYEAGGIFQQKATGDMGLVSSNNSWSLVLNTPHIAHGFVAWVGYTSLGPLKERLTLHMGKVVFGRELLEHVETICPYRLSSGHEH